MKPGIKKVIIFGIVLVSVVLLTIVAILIMRAKNPAGYKKAALIILAIEFIAVLILYYLISNDKIKF